MKTSRRVLLALAVVVAGVYFFHTRQTSTAVQALATVPLPPLAVPIAVRTNTAHEKEVGSDLMTSAAVLALDAAPDGVLRSPSSAERPYIRIQVTPAGAIEGIFATRCAPVRQARSVEAKDGYYYRLVSETGDVILDGSIAKPVTRHQQHVKDHGVDYVVCPTAPLDLPVFFDLPNVPGRLEIYKTESSSVLLANELPLIRAINLIPAT